MSMPRPRLPAAARAAAALLLLLFLPSVAAEEGRTAFTLVGNAASRFVLDGVSDPELVVPPNATIVLTLVQQGSLPHNVKVGDGPASAVTKGEGDSVQLTFTAPASGHVEYVCTLHGATMRGWVRVAGSPPVEKEAPEAGLPLVALALAGAALLAARRRP